MEEPRISAVMECAGHGPFVLETRLRRSSCNARVFRTLQPAAVRVRRGCVRPDVGCVHDAFVDPAGTMG